MFWHNKIKKTEPVKFMTYALMYALSKGGGFTMSKAYVWGLWSVVW